MLSERKRKKFVQEFNNRFNYVHSSLSSILQNDERKAIEMSAGKNYVMDRLLKIWLAPYQTYLNNVVSEVVSELNRTLRIVQPSKHDESYKTVIYQRMESFVNGVQRSAEQYLRERIASYGNIPTNSAVGGISCIHSLCNQFLIKVKREINEVIKDYNLNCQGLLSKTWAKTAPPIIEGLAKAAYDKSLNP